MHVRRVLVCVASKHGATLEIGQAIGARLRAAGLEVEVRDPEANPPVEEYDAFVIGSGVYIGKWLGSARDFVFNNAGQLRHKPVWLFSSGPIGDKRDPADAADGLRLLAEVEGRQHRVFAGSIEKNELGLTERLAIRMVKAPYGDYRPWSEIEAWSDSIAAELTAVPV